MIWEVDSGEKAIEGLDAQGRPDPGYARALGLVPARSGMRVLSTLTELVVAVLLALPAALVLTPIALSIAAGTFDAAAFGRRGDLVWLLVAVIASYVLTTAYTVVQLILHGRKGVTLGKAIFGIRSVNVRTLERPGFWRGAVVRYLILGASFLVPVIGPLLVIAISPFLDAERRGRGWPDLAAATWFIDVRGGLDPYDVKRMRIARKQQYVTLHEEKPPLPSLATAVDRPGTAEYVPSGRFSGGVLGARRLAGAPDAATPATGPTGGGLATPPAPATTSAAAGTPGPASAPAPAPFAPAGTAAAAGMITGVPSLKPVAEGAEPPARAVPTRGSPAPAAPAPAAPAVQAGPSGPSPSPASVASAPPASPAPAGAPAPASGETRIPAETLIPVETVAPEQTSADASPAASPASAAPSAPADAAASVRTPTGGTVGIRPSCRARARHGRAHRGARDRPDRAFPEAGRRRGIGAAGAAGGRQPLGVEDPPGDHAHPPRPPRRGPRFDERLRGAARRRRERTRARAAAAAQRRRRRALRRPDAAGGSAVIARPDTSEDER
ncbi:RDD family protein [Microbacterium sp. KUDC0406]|nr:RDD family protein [Microbacterium sp. KUDC0406]UJP09180.1 RDD family protein [Microbacterium sp. KUDC0406]